METPDNPPIIVTGPQRSGTTIATHILAYDLNLTAIDETQFQFGKDYTNCVIQLPTALDNYVIFQHAYPDCHFVFIKRPRKDIIASMKRIKWCQDDVNDWETFLKRYVDSRFKLWNHVKQQIPLDCSEIYYNALTEHPLFVHQDLRQDFTSKQWQLDKPVGPRYWSNNSNCIQETYGSRCTSSIKERLQAISPGLVAATRPALPDKSTICHR